MKETKDSREKVHMLLEKKYGNEYVNYREKYHLASEKKAHYKVPLHIDIDLTNSCNMSCINCNAIPVLNKNIPRYEIDADILKKRLKEAIPLGVKSVNFGNASEPLLSQEILFEIIDFVKKNGVIDIFIHTNGLLLTEDVSERLIKSGVITLAISLDATNEETSKEIGRNGFTKVVNNISKFIEIRSEMNSAFPFFRLSFLTSQLNYKEVDEFKDIWKGKADLIDIQAVFNINNDEQISDLFDKYDYNCVEPWRRMPIWPNNTYGACCQFYSFHPDKEKSLNLGSLYKYSIEEVWNSAKMQDLRKSLSTENLLNVCKECSSNIYIPKSLKFVV